MPLRFDFSTFRSETGKKRGELRLEPYGDLQVASRRTPGHQAPDRGPAGARRRPGPAKGLRQVAGPGIGATRTPRRPEPDSRPADPAPAPGAHPRRHGQPRRGSRTAASATTRGRPGGRRNPLGRGHRAGRGAGRRTPLSGDQPPGTQPGGGHRRSPGAVRPEAHHLRPRQGPGHPDGGGRQSLRPGGHRGPRTLSGGPGAGRGRDPLRHRGDQRQPLQPADLAARRGDRVDPRPRRARQSARGGPGVRLGVGGGRRPGAHHPPGRGRSRQHPPPGVRAPRLGHSPRAQARSRRRAFSGRRGPADHAQLSPHRLPGRRQPSQDAQRARHRREAPSPGRPHQAHRIRKGDRAAGLDPPDRLRRKGGPAGVRPGGPGLVARTAQAGRRRGTAPPPDAEPPGRAAPGHRSHRQRQDHDALLGAPARRDARSERRDDRGPGGAGLPAAQPGAGESPHPLLVCGRHSQRAPPGSGHPHGGRDPGRRNRGNGGPGRPDRTPRPLDPPHERRPRRRHPARRSRRAALPDRHHAGGRGRPAARPHDLPRLRPRDGRLGPGSGDAVSPRGGRTGGPGGRGLCALPRHRLPGAAGRLRDPAGRFPGVRRDPGWLHRRGSRPLRTPPGRPEPPPGRGAPVAGRRNHRHRGDSGDGRRPGPGTLRGSARTAGYPPPGARRLRSRAPG